MITRALVIAPSALVGGVLGLWIADREPPVASTVQQVVNEPIRPGAELLVRYTVVRYRSCASQVDRLLSDAQGVRYVLDDLEFKAAPGPLGEATYTSPVPIPRTFGQGVGRYRVSVTYICNPVHRLWPITVQSREIAFMVEGAPADP